MTYLGTPEGARNLASQDVPERIEQLTFDVAGTAVPQGSKRAQLVNGRIHMYEANKALPAWRKAVTEAAEAALAGRLGFPKDACCVLTVTFYMPRPKTVTRPRPNTFPDCDKLCRAIGDALTDAGVWVDDGQVVELHAREFYADDQPFVRVNVSAL